MEAGDRRAELGPLRAGDTGALYHGERPLWRNTGWLPIGAEIVRRRYRTTDQGVIINILLVLYSGMIIGSFVFALTGTFILAVVGFCLSQTLRNIGRPLLLLWINQNVEKKIRATLISSYWQANALGQIVGSPMLGWLGTVPSLRLALGIGTGLYTATLPLLLFAQRRWNQTQRKCARWPET
jgi:MFS family permease